jgi:hypothetical protein
MSVYLVNLTINQETTIVSRSGDRVTGTDYVSEGSLGAHLILSANEGDHEMEPLGFVHLHIKASPLGMPAMTPEQTLEWLRDALKRML